MRFASKATLQLGRRRLQLSCCRAVFWTQRKACHKWLDPSSAHPLPRIFTSFATSFSATMHAAEHMDGVQKGRFCSCAPDCVQLNWLTNPASYKRRSKKKGRRRHVAFYF
ncbi:unnamed protein product [Effrenium voratum]|nr:unnamed protein product [Effrenium voratum]